MRRWLALAIYAVGISACGNLGPRDISELLVRDSTYYDPETLEPYSGPVYRPFDSIPDEVLLRGRLRDGTWNGELTVYHPNGMVRYQGEMANGAQCGGWLENDDDTELASEYEELVRELESIVMYPACP